MDAFSCICRSWNNRHTCLLFSMEKWSFTHSSCINRNWDISAYASVHDFSDDFRPYLSRESGKYLDYRNCTRVHLGQCEYFGSLDYLLCDSCIDYGAKNEYSRTG